MKNSKKKQGAGAVRPCYVGGRRALFHRWIDSAHPVTPIGVPEDENTTRFQFWSVRALVEYEDGTLARAWPSEIVFADGSVFSSYKWEELTDAIKEGNDA